LKKLVSKADHFETVADCIEPDFNQVLMVNYSLRMSAASVWKDEIAKAEEGLVSQVTGVVALLFPHRSEAEILKGVRKLVKKALSIKHHISEEKALYYWNWVTGGKEFDQRQMHPSGEENQGLVVFCTFPGLVRLDLQAKAKVPNVVVKASVLLLRDLS
jgi:hypothetical protein